MLDFALIAVQALSASGEATPLPGMIEKYGLPTAFAVALAIAMWKLLGNMIGKFEHAQERSDKNLSEVIDRFEKLNDRLGDVIERNTQALSEVKTLVTLMMTTRSQRR